VGVVGDWKHQRDGTFLVKNSHWLNCSTVSRQSSATLLITVASILTVTGYCECLTQTALASATCVWMCVWTDYFSTNRRPIDTEMAGQIGEEDAPSKASITFPPSHILQHDGTFANLPAPSKLEHIRFFERSIARHGLLEADLKPDGGTDGKPKVDEDDDGKKKEIEQPMIHPLLMASGRLQSSGINELNRAINLSSLAGAGEYFRLTNIVESSIGDTDKHIQALYVLKRKRRAFQITSAALTRHKKRLSAALVVQSQPDQRLRRLRPHWRLVAPEHVGSLSFVTRYDC
jgi:hypothetical protein